MEEKKGAMTMRLMKMTFPAMLSILSIAFFLPNASNSPALEMSGVLTLAESTDSMRVDFSKLDTPACAIGYRYDTVIAADMILGHGQNANFILRTPYTPDLDGFSIAISRFSGSYPTNVDSLRRIFLPVAASVNPECRQSGHCDTAGGGFFLRTSENGVVFWRPIGIYIGGIDRFYLFWAYSSDGTFGGSTAIKPEPSKIRLTTLSFQERTVFSLYDLRGRRLSREMKIIADKSLRKNSPFIITNDITGQSRIFIRVEAR